MAPRIQSSVVITADLSIDVGYPTGNPPVAITFSTGDTYADTDALLADLVAKLAAAALGAWSATVVSERIRIQSPALNFDWTWDASAILRDWLGYTGNVVNQANPWNSSAKHEGGLYPDELLVRGIEPGGYQLAGFAQAAQSIAGNHDALGAAQGYRRQRELAIDIERTAGAWTDIVRFRDLMGYLADSRPFTVWPDDSDLLTFFAFRFVGPDIIMEERRFENEWDRFRVAIQVEEQA
jgi:hypothetical protein